MGRELTRAHDLLLTIGQRSAEERVAAFLLALSRRNASAGARPDLIALPMTRTDIGDLLALTIETVSRILSRMRRQGIIDLERSHMVRILDIQALARLATGNLVLAS
jgi:CRP/FNR family transcriptional regulator